MKVPNDRLESGNHEKNEAPKVKAILGSHEMCDFVTVNNLYTPAFRNDQAPRIFLVGRGILGRM